MQPKFVRSTARARRAIDIRDAAVSHALARGTWEWMPKVGVVRLAYDRDGLSISLSPPFSQRDALTHSSEYQAALREYGVAMPGQLDIWSCAIGKVLNIAWDRLDWPEIVSFRRGAWEEQILQLGLPVNWPDRPAAAVKMAASFLMPSRMIH